MTFIANRPPEMWSMVAICLAPTSGCIRSVLEVAITVERRVPWAMPAAQQNTS
jgi:hypothetical protein